MLGPVLSGILLNHSVSIVGAALMAAAAIGTVVFLRGLQPAPVAEPADHAESDAVSART